MCLNIIVFVLFLLFAPSYKAKLGNVGPVISLGSYQGVISIAKTNDMAAKNLYKYIMDNPDKLDDRSKMAGNVQESGIDLYQKNISILSSEKKKVPREVSSDMETLMEYYTLNKRLFTRLKASIENKKDVSQLESGSLKQKIDAMTDRVEEIYDRY